MLRYYLILESFHCGFGGPAGGFGGPAGGFGGLACRFGGADGFGGLGVMENKEVSVVEISLLEEILPNMI